jgi:hypothetical protein
MASGTATGDTLGGLGMKGIETTRVVTDDYVEFWPAGKSVKGEFHCAECGYGVTIVRALPLCPMCGGATWEQSAWSPFTRSQRIV